LQAVTLGWVDFRNFDLQQFDFFEAVENGDLTVVIPGKFVAFAGPTYNGWTPPPGYYAQHFKRMGVTTVIRTNNKLYDRTEFTRYGLKHYDLFFPDGTPPPEAQVGPDRHLTLPQYFPRTKLISRCGTGEALSQHRRVRARDCGGALQSRAGSDRHVDPDVGHEALPLGGE
jgi:hypothetical protein